MSTWRTGLLTRNHGRPAEAIGLCRYIALFATLALALPSGATAQAIRVGSKNFSEQFLIAELYAGALEAAGYQVERKLNLGSTFAAHEALKADLIDVYPEYTGTGLTTILKEAANDTDPDRVFERVRSGYRHQFEFEWLKRSGVNNGYVVVVRPEVVAKHNLTTLSDLSRVSRELSLAVTAEFAERPDGLPGLAALYGIEFGTMRAFTSMRLRYEGMLQGRYDVTSGFATDWQIAARGLVALRDDKGLFPPYELAPVARGSLARDRKAVAALDGINALLDTEKMRAMNEQVERLGRQPREVAADFLREHMIAK
jgi:osmoprotectant transport system substrate-binding protein